MSASIVLKMATPNQTRFACLNFHYAKSVPSAAVSFACFEDNKFVGVIVYGGGANKYIGNQYGMKQGQVYELVRVALNKEQHKMPTTKYVAISLRLLKKVKPLTRVVVSYADRGYQHHEGIIYKAGNWIFDGVSKSDWIMVNGKPMHPRSANAKWGSLKNIPNGYEYIKGAEKLKYLYFFDKELELKYMRQKHKSNVSSVQEEKGGAIPTLTHQA